MKKINFKPYAPIQPTFEVAKRLNIPESDIIKLDANENPYGCLPEVSNRLANFDYYHVYPDPSQRRTKENIASYAGCDFDQIVVGNGADEIIDLVLRFLLEPGQAALLFEPCFTYYEHVLKVNGLKALKLKRDSNFLINQSVIKNFNFSKVKLVIITSPNNPTGDLVSFDVLEKILESKTYVLLDEAYFEFSQVTALKLLAKYPNLILCRTFSKMFGLAGLRLGYGIMHKNLAKKINLIRAPYNINVAAEEALAACLPAIDKLQKVLSMILRTREFLFKQLFLNKKIQVFKSYANFVLFRPLNYDFEKLHQKLEKSGILTRIYGNQILKGYIRVSVGTDSQIKIFLQRLFDIIKN